MNLINLRKQFLSASGRADLVGPNGEDTGANFYLNAGQRYLDRSVTTAHTIARRFFELKEGDLYVATRGCRFVQEVWCNDLNTRWRLEKKNIIELRQLLTTGEGPPMFYAPSTIRSKDNESIQNMQNAMMLMDFPMSGQQQFTGIMLTPKTPVGGPYYVEIFGAFYTEELEEDGDETFWSFEHPNLLIMAAMRELEIVMRNTAGQRDWEAAIGAELLGIEFDTAEQEAVDIDQLEG